MDIRTANAGVTTSIVEVLGDGACFFRAVLVALRLKNLSAFSMPEEEHITLRKLIVDFTESSDVTYNVYTTEYAGKEEWIREMSKPNVWADNIAVEACSHFLEIPIEIISFGVVVGQFGGKYGYRCNTTGVDNIIRLRLENGHYSVIV